MASIPKEIQEFMAKWSVATSEIWPVPGGKSYAVKHSALERIAAEQGIIFGPPHLIESDGQSKVYSLWVDARMEDRIEWSTGEASPANNKNAYPLAMAEKRAKDRCVLKLLAAHGLVYSEDEADSFKEPANRYEPPGEPVEPPLMAGPEALERHVTKGLDHPPGKNKPPHWDAITKLVDNAENYTDLTYQMSQPFYKNTTSGWSNFYRRKLADDHIVPKYADFRGSEAAIKLQKEIHAKYPLDTFSRQEAAE
jgi:hypothetical protein